MRGETLVAWNQDAKALRAAAAAVAERGNAASTEVEVRYS